MYSLRTGMLLDAFDRTLEQPAHRERRDAIIQYLSMQCCPKAVSVHVCKPDARKACWVPRPYPAEPASFSTLRSGRESCANHFGDNCWGTGRASAPSCSISQISSPGPDVNLPIEYDGFALRMGQMPGGRFRSAYLLLRSPLVLTHQFSSGTVWQPCYPGHRSQIWHLSLRRLSWSDALRSRRA